MKRLFIGAAFFFFLFAPSIAWSYVAFGPQAGVCLEASDQSVSDFYSLSLGGDFTPWNLTFGVSPSENTFIFTADNWWIYHRIAGTFNYQLFWGNWTSFYYDDDWAFLTGPRLGVGVNLFLLPSNRLELYANAAWNPLVGITVKTEESPEFAFYPLVFPVSAGLRLWIK